VAIASEIVSSDTTIHALRQGDGKRPLGTLLPATARPAAERDPLRPELPGEALHTRLGTQRTRAPGRGRPENRRCPTRAVNWRTSAARMLTARPIERPMGVTAQPDVDRKAASDQNEGTFGCATQA
jgi:hypothetical protein